MGKGLWHAMVEYRTFDIVSRSCEGASPLARRSRLLLLRTSVSPNPKWIVVLIETPATVRQGTKPLTGGSVALVEAGVGPFAAFLYVVQHSCNVTPRTPKALVLLYI